jgi:hypothetical protein
MLGNKLTKIVKGGIKMTDTIDLHDLPEDEVKLVKEFVEFLKRRVKMRKEKIGEKEEIAFATWPLGVKGKLTRREIYDYL